MSHILDVPPQAGDAHRSHLDFSLTTHSAEQDLCPMNSGCCVLFLVGVTHKVKCAVPPEDSPPTKVSVFSEKILQ